MSWSGAGLGTCHGGWQWAGACTAGLLKLSLRLLTTASQALQGSSGLSSLKDSLSSPALHAPAYCQLPWQAALQLPAVLPLQGCRWLGKVSNSSALPMGGPASCQQPGNAARRALTC